MTPSELKQYLQQHRQASLSDMAVRFDSDPEAVRGAMAPWLRKGRVVEIAAAGSACNKGCCTCSAKGNSLFAWQEPEPTGGGH